MINKNETYGVEVTAETSKFKKKMQELANLMKNFGKQAEEETTIAPKMNYNGYVNQINYVKKQLDKVAKQIENTKYDNATNQVLTSFKNKLNIVNDAIEEQLKTDQAFMKLSGINYEYTSKEMEALLKERERIEKNINNLVQNEDNEPTEEQLKLQAKYERLQATLKNLIDNQDEYNRKLGETEKISAKNRLAKMFDTGIGKIKKFTFYLLGARSVFSLFMKYQSIYYQYNEQMQYQSELSQNAIALSLAPAFELLGKVMTYASIAFARFIQLLTGVNVLSKVTTKGIRDYNKSLKETQTLVSGIDEITNLTMPNNTGLANQYKALKDFQDQVNEFDKWFNKIKQKISDYFDFEKGWNLFKVKFPKMLKWVYDFAIGSWLGPFVEKIKKDLEPIWQPIKTKFEEVLKQIEPLWNDFLKPKIIDPVTDKLNEAKNKILKEFAPFLNNLIYYYNITIGKILGPIDYIEIEVDKTQDNIEKDVKQTEKNIETNTTTTVNNMKKDINQINNLKPKFSITAVVSSAENTLRKFFAKLGIKWGSNTSTMGLTMSAAINSVGDYFNNTKGYAKGLDYVPYDNYPALLHKGESVVPAKYNPTIHSQGNEYTNSLLETMIIKLDDLARRPNEFNIDGQKFANATYPLYENARTQQNYVEGVVR